MRFAPEYISIVLNENFEDAKELLLSPLMAINYAHLVMLAEQGIMSREDARALRDALDGISLDSVREVTYDGTYEDLFFYIERLIDKAAGEDIAGRLHTARSRNDIAMTMYRMLAAGVHRGGRAGAIELRAALIDAGRRGITDTIYGAHTHTQPAQPTTIAHYLLAIIEQLERDTARLAAALRVHEPQSARRLRDHRHRVSNRSRTAPASCSASRRRPATPTAASRRSTTCSRACRRPACCSIGLGRVVQDLLLWCTMEFGYLRLSDGFVQGSSIMPQKRNPVALEHARAIGSKAVGQAQAIATAVHNTPFGDIVDTEDDLQPLVASMFRDATRMVTLVGGGDARRRFRRRKAGVARGRGRHHAHRTGRHAGARPRSAVPLGACDCRDAAEGANRGSARRPLSDALARRRRRRFSAGRSPIREAELQTHHEPRALRRRSARPTAVRRRTRRCRALASRSRSRSTAIAKRWQARREHLGARGAPAREPASRRCRCRCSAHYLRVLDRLGRDARRALLVQRYFTS